MFPRLTIGVGNATETRVQATSGGVLLLLPVATERAKTQPYPSVPLARARQNRPDQIYPSVFCESEAIPPKLCGWRSPLQTSTIFTQCLKNVSVRGQVVLLVPSLIVSVDWGAAAYHA